MNIYINSLSNSIVLSKPFSKKALPFYQEYFFEYSLKSFESKIKAVNELLNGENKGLFKDEQVNSLILSDDVVFHGLTQVPTFSGGKSKDAFKTKIKINFPNIKDYFIDYRIEEKNSNKTSVTYSLVQTKQSKQLIEVFENHNIKIKNVNYLAHVLNKTNLAKNNFPQITLIIGKAMSELIIVKGTSILGTSVINLGSDKLLESNSLLDSTYNLNNQVSLKYASFHKTNFDSKDLLTDELINKYPIHESFEIAKPREIRILKGTTLENYTRKQNFLKFHARILDILDAYKDGPYFVPINEIKVYATDEVLELLRAANSSEVIKYSKAEGDLKVCLQEHISHNPLFDKQLLTKERKKIEWSKFFTMEIGRKKKD